MHTTSEITFEIFALTFLSFFFLFRSFREEQRERKPSVLMRSKILTAHCICNSVRNEVGANSGWKGGGDLFPFNANPALSVRDPAQRRN